MLCSPQRVVRPNWIKRYNRIDRPPTSRMSSAADRLVSGCRLTSVLSELASYEHPLRSYVLRAQRNPL